MSKYKVTTFHQHIMCAKETQVTVTILWRYYQCWIFHTYLTAHCSRTFACQHLCYIM